MTIDSDDINEFVLGFRRPKDRNFLPPLSYSAPLEVMTLALVYNGKITYEPTAEYIGEELETVKFDWVDKAHISTLEGLNKYGDECLPKGRRSFYVRKNCEWLLIGCDMEAKSWVEYTSSFHHGEARYFIDIHNESVGDETELEVDNVKTGRERSVEIISPGCFGRKSGCTTTMNPISSSAKNLFSRECGTSNMNLEMGKQLSYSMDRESDAESNYEPSWQHDSIGDDHLYDRNVIFSDEKLSLNETDEEPFEQELIVSEEVVDYEGYVSDEYLAGDSDAPIDSELDSDKEEEGRPKGRPKKVYGKSHQMINPQLAYGMRFSNKVEFRKVIRNHAISETRNVSIARSDSLRAYAKCDVPSYGWLVHIKYVKPKDSWVVHKYEPEHTCSKSYNVHNLKSTYLAERFVGMFKSDPKRGNLGFRQDVKEALGIDISKTQAYRAKRLAVDKLNGDPEEQFLLLFDYSEEVKRTNPGSTSLVETDPETGNFWGFYTCLYALKQGFLESCRPVIGVDGCHLSGPHGGVLLTAVGIDPNNKPYPIAWAMVCNENGETWGWFLRLLKLDLQITSPEEYTFISDKQKGLLKAFAEELPGAYHRFCALHLWKNMFVAGIRGDGYRKAFFKASYATTIGAYRTAMKEIGELDPKALDWLRDKHPTEWSKSHFPTFPKCDNALNNGCENFNKVIVDARKQPIITMFEWIREYMMQKRQRCRDKAAKHWKDKFTPVVKIAMNKNNSQLRYCIAQKSDETNYQITENGGDQFCVDLARKSCTCRKYDLTGIPCKHVVSAVAAATKADAYSFVHDQYTVENYKRCYKEPIYGINGAELWGETFYVPPLPPNFGRKGRVGAPQFARRKGKDEPNQKGRKRKKSHVKRTYSVTCSYCGAQGHNINGCKEKPEQHNKEDDETRAYAFEDEERIRTGEDELMAAAERSAMEEHQAEEISLSQLSMPVNDTDADPQPRKKPRKMLAKVRHRYLTTVDDQIPAPTVDVQIVMSQGQVPQKSPFPPTLNVRVPPAMKGNQFLNNIPSQSSQDVQFETFVVDGKKYVHLSQIPFACDQLKKNKEKKKSKQPCK